MHSDSVVSPSDKRIRFGLYEADLKSGELTKSGHRLALQSQPFQALAMLLEHPGEIVTKDEFRHLIWGEDIIVDFDQSLRAAITKVREVLGDSSDNPRFIETIPRRGYRFIAPVFVEDLANPAAEPLKPGQPLTVPVSLQPSASTAPAVNTNSRFADFVLHRIRWVAAIGVCVLLLCGALLWHIATLRASGVAIPAMRQLTFENRIVVPIPVKYAEQFPSIVTDGVHLFTTAVQNGHTALVQLSINGGDLQEVVMPDEILGPTLGDISPDNSRLLLVSHLPHQAELPLWVVPVGGGAARLLPGVQGHDATWMPNGSDILYAANNELRILHPQNNSTALFAKISGRAFWLRWSPDGTKLRFTMIDPVAHSQSLWEISADGSRVKPLLKHWDEQSNVCCGIWTRDGASFIFQSMQDGESDLWLLPSRGGTPQRLTNGPLIYEGPVASRLGNRIFLTGVTAQPLIQIFDTATQTMKPANNLLRDAQEVTFSSDGLWVAWVDGSGRLWRARADGKDMVQLSPESLQTYMARWSPDNSRLAVMARQANQPWQLYLIRSDGGGLERLQQEPRNEADPAWSPNGQTMAFGRAPDYLAKDESPWTIRILDLATKQVSSLPGSDGLFSPRWSPDGKYIAALSSDQTKLVLFNWQTRQWKLLASGQFSNPSWSADSQTVYIQGSEDKFESIVRISIPDGRLERFPMPNSTRTDIAKDYSFIGLAPGNAPLLRIRETGDIYSLSVTGSH